MGFFRNITAFILLVGYTLTATALMEVCKLPKLIEHYFDHNREQVNTRLISYLLQHYGTEDGTDKDAAEDRKLPFQSTEYSSLISLVSVSPPGISQGMRLPATVSDNDFSILNEARLTVPYISMIWQPPRHY